MGVLKFRNVGQNVVLANTLCFDVKTPNEKMGEGVVKRMENTYFMDINESIATIKGFSISGSWCGKFDVESALKIHTRIMLSCGYS
jgi:hypothetical protein